MRGFDAGLQRTMLPQRIDQQQHIAALAQRLHLLGENLLRCGLRGQRAQQHAVGRQRHGRQARAFAFEAAHEGGAEMLCQRRAAAQPADEHFAAGGDAADQRLRGIGDRPGQAFCGLVLEVSAVEKLLLDALFEHEHGSYDTTPVRRFRGHDVRPTARSSSSAPAPPAAAGWAASAAATAASGAWRRRATRAPAPRSGAAPAWPARIPAPA